MEGKTKIKMKTNQEILDLFGKMIIKDCFDPTFANMGSLKNKENPPIIFEDYSDLFKRLSNTDFNILKRYLKDSLGALLFDVLRIFEENPEFKIIYEEDGRQVDLNKISEMLKAEPIIENGWIQRFSEEIRK
jgi:hypothetical protein